MNTMYVHTAWPNPVATGSLQSLDWTGGRTGGLDQWTGLVDSHFFCIKNHLCSQNRITCLYSCMMCYNNRLLPAPDSFDLASDL